MVLDVNSENWTPPSENQVRPNTSSQSETKPFFEQECLQQTWLNVKLATWIKSLIVIAVLIALAAYVTPKLSTAQSLRQQKAAELDLYQCEEGSWIDSNECFID
jgi:nitric oxide reductase large subunit